MWPTKEAKQLVIDDQSRQQSDIDIIKRIKYVQGYRDREEGKKPRYPLEDEEEETSGDEVGSEDVRG